MSPKRSRVHPPYKTKYRVSNSAEYDQAPLKLGSITFWISSSAIKNWNAKPSGERGGQAKFSDLAIKTALTLALAFHLPLRQTEGFVTSIFELMSLHLDVLDHTTLSRLSKALRVKLRVPRNDGPIDLIIDSSGLSIVGHNGWSRISCGHDRNRRSNNEGLTSIASEAKKNRVNITTDSNVDDAKTGVKMIISKPRATRRHGAPFQDVNTGRHTPATLRSHNLLPPKRNPGHSSKSQPTILVKYMTWRKT